MLRKKNLYNQAILLRQKGLSYKEIKALVPVSGSTISRWCGDVSLTEKQKERIRDKQINNKLIRHLKEGAREGKELAKIWAKDKFTELNFKSNSLLIIGAMLYWAEGHNTGKSSNAIFTNTDAEMIKIIMKFFREEINVGDSKIKIKVRLSYGGNVASAEKYWANVTGLTLDRFQKVEIIKTNKSSQSLEKHPNGICRVSVYDVSVRRKIDNLIELLKQAICPRSSEDRAVHS